jgi:tRNA pseudouridine55 synthase
MTHFGILNANKPAGCTSRDAVNRVERLCRPAKAGHAGTLDPLATGVLVICVGQATRLIQYVQQMRKLYRATFLLGRRSETDDIDGQIVETHHTRPPTSNELARALPQFVGRIQQRPPAYSAVKVSGRRAYELARKGATVELAPRLVTIYRLQLTRFDYPELELEVECGSGTYVRALGRDLAAALGTSAVMAALERAAVGGFRVEDAVPLEDLNIATIAEHLQPPLAAAADLPRAILDASQLAEIRHGRPITILSKSTTASPIDPEIEWAAVDTAGRLVAILRQNEPNRFWPIKNLS